MYFAPQRRALFRHLNFQKWSECEVLLAFSLANVLHATTACNFSSLIWPDGSAPAALASLLFDPPAPQIIGKTQCFATFLPFRASPSSFFRLFLFSHLLSSTLLFSLTLPISAFHLSILSEVWLLNFLRRNLRWRNQDRAPSLVTAWGGRTGQNRTHEIQGKPWKTTQDRIPRKMIVLFADWHVTP